MQELIEKKFITDTLQRAICPKCRASLESAEVYTITQAPTSLIAHATCLNCQTASMVTITTAGTGLMPIKSDMQGDEFRRFADLEAVNYEDVLDLHEDLKKENLWNWLHKKEKLQEKK